jgi:hypothetical protein
MPSDDKAIRKQLVEFLRGGQAHARFEDVVRNFPAKLRGVVPPSLPYSAWQVLEHIRIAQDDIVCFSMNRAPAAKAKKGTRVGRYRSLKWPQDYWPKSPQPPAPKSWQESVRQIGRDRDQMVRLVSDPANDLLKPFPWGEGQNLLREALLVATHGSHHLGELIVIRRLLGAWPAK